MKTQASPVQIIRQRDSQAAGHRRSIALLSTLGILDFSIISLYQLGIIRRLPDLPGKWFDTNRINASEDAQIAGIPDGPISLLGYAATIALAGMAMKRGKSRNPYDYAMAGIAVSQAAAGAYYLFNMASVQKQICIYCVKGALINFASLVPLAKLFRKS